MGWMHDQGLSGLEKSRSLAMEWWTKAAQSEYANSQYALEYAYGEGLGNYKEAVKWYGLAADQGLLSAQVNLGICFDHGRGCQWTRPNPPTGSESRRREEILSPKRISVYRNVFGEGVAQDYGEAAKWWRLSAAQGNTETERALGLCYINGKGAPLDFAEATKWFTKAAEKGHSAVQWNLAQLLLPRHRG
ncbi:HCP-like protein [Gonapodya prolifera JEL478]|uniref:HCP-like protein n=1 Tax=Gonapodya prolifera (strain JEL478) TaxID=1344416 RepID=A0A139A0T2_GONPJ|nr:HCP-like protein [Gonapodya prolifera JEL478]|eukprot:KXS10371.1 HCP-like protein [Gonapodya prolifera JEL478]